MSKEIEWLRKMKGNSGNGTIPANGDIREFLSETANTSPADRQGSSKTGFDAVAGMDSLKSLIREGFINVLKHPRQAELYGVSIPNILLYGPAGCGKTYFAERMAEEVNINFMKISPDDLSSIYVHGTQQKIGELFKKAEQKAPVLLFFDEFDCMVPQRTSDVNKQYQTDEVDEFLTMLNNTAKRGIYVVAATNRPQNIDSSVLRNGRMDEKIYIPMPDKETRASLFRHELDTRPISGNVNYCALADLTNGYNCSDISHIVKTAARKKFNLAIASSVNEAIRQEDLEEAILHTIPSVSETDIRAFERVKRDFTPRAIVGEEPRIGFR